MWMKEKSTDWVTRRKLETYASLTSVANDNPFRSNCIHRWFNVGIKYAKMKSTLDSIEESLKTLSNIVTTDNMMNALPESFFSQHQNLLKRLLDDVSSIQFQGEDLLLFLEGYESTEKAESFIAEKTPFRYCDKYLKNRNLRALVYECERTYDSCSQFLYGVDDWLSKGGSFQVDYHQDIEYFVKIDPSRSISHQINTGVNLITSGFRLTGLFNLVRCIEYTLRCICRCIPEYSMYTDKSFNEMVIALSTQNVSEDKNPILDKMASKSFQDMKNIRNAIAHWDTGNSIEGDFIYTSSPEHARLAIFILRYLAKWIYANESEISTPDSVQD